MADQPIVTFQTRLSLDETGLAVLQAYADLYGRAERSLFAAIQAGERPTALKSTFLTRFGLTARQFNAIRAGLDGKIASIKERRPELIAEAEDRIKKAHKVITKLEKYAPGTNQLHQKKRRLATLQRRMEAMKADHAAGRVRLCFGSRKLFRAQFALEANGFASLDAWRETWQTSRASQCFVIGSKDETAGCQGCQAKLEADGSLTLTLRLPDALSSHGKHLTLRGVRFAYGHATLLAALASSRRETTPDEASGNVRRKLVGTAISYRFLRDDKGWRVFASTTAQPVKRVTHRLAGAVGVDTNADHLAVSEVDRFGNLVKTWKVPMSTYGKTGEQARAIIGEMAVEIARMAQKAGKPVVIEKLDFRKRKSELESRRPGAARMLSSLAYRQVSASLQAACFRAGVEVIAVNPAYTSVIGAVNAAQQRGISVHQGAAFAIARRGLGLSERPTVREAIVPTLRGDHVTFLLPERNRRKHVWSFWSGVRTRLKAAHVAHIRCGWHRQPPPPLPPEGWPASCAIWLSTARIRGANRSQHCSESVSDEDIPQ